MFVEIKDKRARSKAPTIGLRYNHVLANTLVHFTLKDGKKDLAIRLINQAFDRLKESLSIREDDDFNSTLDQMVSRSIIMVDFFKRRIGSRNYRIFYQRSYDRSFRHSVKRLYKLVVSASKGKKYVDCLHHELKLIAENDRSNSLLLIEKARVYKEAKDSKGLDYLISNFKIKPDQSIKIDPAIFNE